LARECQASQLAGKVIRHVFDPTPDAAFQEQEAVQLERTLMALMPLLVEEEIQFGNYCSAFGICTKYVHVVGDDATFLRSTTDNLQRAVHSSRLHGSQRHRRQR